MQTGVAIVDTGIYRHRDFGSRITGFVDLVHGKNSAYDDSGHGTHIAGIIGGDGSASRGRYKGIAPHSALIGVKVLDAQGNGKISDVVEGLRWILEQIRQSEKTLKQTMNRWYSEKVMTTTGY